MRLYSTNELLRMPPPTWLIEPVMPQGGLVGLYGPPGVGKSFLAIDIALSIASGRPWQGHQTQSGAVLYVAAEGSAGITKRVAAWLKVHVVRPGDVRVAWLTTGVPVNADSKDMSVLMDRISHELRDTPTLIIIDTLARCFDGDENQQEDMGRFIGGVDLLRREYEATVMVVHHTRLDGERERGNTAFRGAADTMMSIKRKSGSATIGLSCNKQKDAEEFPMLEFVMVPVPEHGSCVLEKDIKKAGKQEKRGEVYHILRTQGLLSWNEWQALAQSQGISRSSFARVMANMRENDDIVKQNGKWRLKVNEP